jgi:hypothetical protein
MVKPSRPHEQGGRAPLSYGTVPVSVLGRTANLAVLGGNLPPSRASGSPFSYQPRAFDGRAGHPTERASGPFHPAAS